MGKNDGDDKTREGQEIKAELRALRRLVALSVIEDKRQMDQIRLLTIAGLDRNEIAELVGTTPLTVSVSISNMRKEGVIGGKKRTPKQSGR